MQDFSKKNRKSAIFVRFFLLWLLVFAFIYATISRPLRTSTYGLVRLLCRLLLCECKGKAIYVQINGQNVRKMSVSSFRMLLYFILFEPAVFLITVAIVSVAFIFGHVTGVFVVLRHAVIVIGRCFHTAFPRVFHTFRVTKMLIIQAKYACKYWV